MTTAAVSCHSLSFNTSACGEELFLLILQRDFCISFYQEKMRLTSLLNGQHFGNLAKVHGIITYKLSPFEQRAFAGAIEHGVPNMFRRFRSNVFIVAPPFIIGYLVYDLTERRHEHLLRKNPADFADDV